MKSRIAIIGRPNVGKSTLFNLLTDTRKAVVKNEPGVTRDIQIEDAEVWGKTFELLDTGGITDSEDTFSKLIKEQVVDVLNSVDGLIVVMDGRAGLMPEDRDLFRLAKESEKPFLLVVNKLDKEHTWEMQSAEFYEFGVEFAATSFERRHGVDKVLEWLHQNVDTGEETLDPATTLTIVGKPNAGKSSLANFLLGEKRMLVSDIAGTTVDAIDAEFTYKKESYKLVDTAGLRRQAKRTNDVEILSSFKTRDAIKKAQIVLLLVDAIEGPTDQDARIMQFLLEQHKAPILVGNKVDLDKPELRKSFREQAAEVFHFYQDLPISFISAKTGAGIEKLFNTIHDVRAKLYKQIPTGELNRFFMETIRQAPAPVHGTKNVKFYYLTQTRQTPPSFIAFANHPNGVDNAYRRF